MKSVWMVLSFSLLILSCAHKEKEVLVTETPPPETTLVAPPVAVLGPINVSLHGYKQLRAQGTVHFTQDQDTVHVEVILEGMKPGPYKINVSDSKKCQNAKAKGKDLGEVVADGKGKVKTTFDVDTLQPSDLIGKKLIVYTKEKGKAKVAACGIPEKMETPN